MASKKELLESIRSDMQLTKDFLLQVFGYSISDPNFPETAFERIENPKAKECYEKAVSEWKVEHDAMLDRVAAWYRQQVENEHKKEVLLWEKNIDNMTEAEAKQLLKKMMRC